MVKLTLVLALTIATASAANAAPSKGPGDKLYNECTARTSTNTGWAECGGEYLERLDKKLNAAWKKALTSFDTPKDRASLVAEQRAWLRYRDSSCEYYASEDAGRESQVLDFPLCRAQIVEERIADLNVIYVQGHEGDAQKLR